MDRTAFELNVEDYPDFAGALLNAGQGEINIGQALEEGDGLIVIDPMRDSALAELLRAYPAVTEIPEADIPATAVAISPYQRRPLEALQEAARIRGIDAALLDHAKLVKALDDNDAGVQTAQAEAPLPEHKLASLTKEKLLHLVALHGGITVPSGATKDQIIELLVRAGVTEADNAPDPFADVEDDDLEDIAAEHELDTDGLSRDQIIAALVAAGVTNTDQEA